MNPILQLISILNIPKNILNLAIYTYIYIYFAF